MSDLADIRAAIERLEDAVLTPAPLTSDDLQERGYTRQEAYGLLRRHGIKTPGGRRLRISPTVLMEIERGEVPA